MTYRVVCVSCFQILFLSLTLARESLALSEEHQGQVSRVFEQDGKVAVTLPYNDDRVPNALVFSGSELGNSLAWQLSGFFNYGMRSTSKHRTFIKSSYGENFVPVPTDVAVSVHQGGGFEEFPQGMDRRFIISGKNFKRTNSFALIRMMFRDAGRYPDWVIANGTDSPLEFHPGSFPFSQLVYSEFYPPQMLSGIARANEENTVFVNPYNSSGVKGDFGLSVDGNDHVWLSNFAGIPLADSPTREGPVPGYMILPIGSSNDRRMLPKWMQLPDFYPDLRGGQMRNLNALIEQHFGEGQYRALLAIYARSKGHCVVADGMRIPTRMSLPELYVLGAIRDVAENGSLVVQQSADTSPQPWNRLFGRTLFQSEPGQERAFKFPNHLYHPIAYGRQIRDMKRILLQFHN